MRIILFALLLAALISPTSGVFWSGSVSNVTDSSSWSIYRHSGNLSFDLSSSVEGWVAPISVTPEGRILSPYHFHSTDLEANDVRLRERTSALEGKYSSDDEISLEAKATDCVNISIIKPNNSDVWTVTWEENWPVIMNASRSIDYEGRGINDRECIGNNLDAVGSNFLFNREYSKEREANLRLGGMNATVVATNDTIIWTGFMPNRFTDYQLELHSTGIADLWYRQIDIARDVANYGEERYLGTYDISRKIEMRSNFTRAKNGTDWLSCCIGGCHDIDPAGTGMWNASKVFDCG